MPDFTPEQLNDAVRRWTRFMVRFFIIGELTALALAGLVHLIRIFTEAR